MEAAAAALENEAAGLERALSLARAAGRSGELISSAVDAMSLAWENPDVSVGLSLPVALVDPDVYDGLKEETQGYYDGVLRGRQKHEATPHTVPGGKLPQTLADLHRRADKQRAARAGITNAAPGEGEGVLFQRGVGDGASFAKLLLTAVPQFRTPFTLGLKRAITKLEQQFKRWHGQIVWPEAGRGAAEERGYIQPERGEELVKTSREYERKPYAMIRRGAIIRKSSTDESDEDSSDSGGGGRVRYHVPRPVLGKNPWSWADFREILLRPLFDVYFPEIIVNKFEFDGETFGYNATTKGYLRAWEAKALVRDLGLVLQMSEERAWTWRIWADGGSEFAIRFGVLGGGSWHHTELIFGNGKYGSGEFFSLKVSCEKVWGNIAWYNQWRVEAPSRRATKCEFHTDTEALRTPLLPPEHGSHNFYIMRRGWGPHDEDRNRGHY